MVVVVVLLWTTCTLKTLSVYNGIEMNLRFNVVKGDVAFVGKTGGGRSNPIVDALVKAHAEGEITNEVGVEITPDDLAEIYKGDPKKITPSNVVYSFAKRTGVRMGYRRTENGFWLFVK